MCIEALWHHGLAVRGSVLIYLGQGRPAFFWLSSTTVIVGVGGPHVEKSKSGIPKRPNYCVICIVIIYAIDEFAAGRGLVTHDVGGKCRG